RSPAQEFDLVVAAEQVEEEGHEEVGQLVKNPQATQRVKTDASNDFWPPAPAPPAQCNASRPDQAASHLARLSI
ncbi:hypothetical protein, partial [Staphylococcus haemolyticus]|uniref:hypothetical protein n=1 Tax=Staphylococcus haemolyticus TaxID=1283 RepID=UPI0025571394